MTEKELFQEILKRISKDKELSNILEKIRNKTATFEDMQRYSLRTAEIRAEVLKENLSPAGNGQNEEACIQILKDQHEDVFQKESAVQKTLDEKQNIHIEPKKPKFPAERVRKAAHSLEDETVPFETLQRRAENAVANIANTFHDDYIKENAEFRQNAGLKCHVSRIGASKCCAWCAEVAGRFEVGREPADFWRRHDNCSCRIDYENQKVRQRLSGTGRAWEVDSEFQRKQAQRIQYKPTRLNQEQAKAVENEKLSRIKGLTIAGKTDIMKESSSRYKQVTNFAIENMPSIPLFQTKKTGLAFKDKLLAGEAAEKNELYRRACQDLLREAAKHNDLELGTEFGIVYGKNMKPIKDFGYVIGKVGSVNFGSYPDEPFHALHNHPSGETFSYADLLIFTSEPNMISLSAVGNQNNLYVISETDKSDKFGYFSFLKQQTKKVLYTTSVNGQKVEFSYNLVAIEGKKRKEGKKSLISALTEEQLKELEESLVSFSEECVERCEKYGIKYQFRKT